MEEHHDSDRRYQGPLLSLCPKKKACGGHIPFFAQEIIGRVLCQPQTWRPVVPDVFLESKRFAACAKIVIF
jgi:hypothetical protein